MLTQNMYDKEVKRTETTNLTTITNKLLFLYNIHLDLGR